MLIGNVIESYDTVWARRSRRMRCVPETGMGLLLERAVSDEAADFAGSYTECGGLSKLLFANPHRMHQAMAEPPLKSYSVMNGIIQAEHTPEEGEIVHRLDDLVAHLPRTEGKGWEIEFVAHKGEMYAAQITPVLKHPPITVPNDVQSIFEVGQVVGTGDYLLNGILWMPPFPGERDLQALEKFDSEHVDYAVITKEVAIRTSNRNRSQLFMWLLNARAFLFTDMQRAAHPLAAHTEEYLRNTGVALEINNIDVPFKPAYSPTKLRVVADESSGKGVVLLQGLWQSFEELKAS